MLGILVACRTDEVRDMPETGGDQEPKSANIPRHWKQAEQQLRDEREKLLSELVVDSAPPDELADGWQDRDSASEGEIRDVEFGHRGAIRQRILQIERALERIKLDTYGRCVRCGRAIDPARLADEPDVSSCLTCQSGLEGEAGNI
jgi:RNA polymerase-binding transcription factor DksA